MTIASPANNLVSDDVSPEEVSPSAPRSLKSVVEVIPDECYDNPTLRGLGYFFRDLAVYGLVMLALYSTDHIYFVIPLLVLASLAVSGLFVVGHDAAHQALFASRRLNGVVGRLAMLPSLHVFEAWVLGHNRVHHGHTVKHHVDFVWHPSTAEQYAAMSLPSRLLHRFEWSILGYGMYYCRRVWWHEMMSFDPPARWVNAIKRDSWFLKGIVATVGVGLLALGWARYGSAPGAIWMVTKLAVLPFFGFCYVIGIIVNIQHIDRDIKWYRRGSWTKFSGQVEGTTIIHAPRWLDFFLHWILEHSPHHVDMRIPMYHLKRAGQAVVEHFPVPERKFRIRDIVANSRACKLYDFDRQCWMTYGEARRQLAHSRSGSR